MKKSLIYLILILFFATNIISAQEKKGAEAQANFRNSLSDALEIEKENLKDLNTQITEDRLYEKRSELELNTYKLQYSTYANLLLIPETPVKSIEKAYADHLAALNAISSNIKQLIEKNLKIENDTARTTEQISINKKQLSDLSSSRRTKENLKLIQGYKNLLWILIQKEKVLKKLGKLNKKILDDNKEVEKDFIELTKKFNESIQGRKTKSLFTRNMYQLEDLAALKEDFFKIAENIKQLVTKDFWQKEVEFIKKADFLNLVSFFGLYFVFVIILIQIRRFLNAHKETSLLNGYWPDFSKRVLEKSFILFSIAVFLFIFSHLGIYSSKNLLILSVLDLASVLLFSKWMLFTIKELNIKTLINDRSASKLKVFVNLIRVYGIIIVFGNWIYIEQNIIFLTGRLLFLSLLLGWNFWFWLDLKDMIPQESENTQKFKIFLNTIKYLMYTIISVSLVSDITGFGTFGFYWIVSWARTMMVIFWTAVVVFAILELSKKEKREKKEKKQMKPFYESEISEGKIHVYWFVSRLGSLVVFFLFAISIVYAWGGKETILINTYSIIKKDFLIGSWNISIMNFFFAIITLILTNATAKIWRHFFTNTILKESGIDVGVQESVSMISFYLVWFIGILVALNFFGVNMKSVAVLFGALGIGLGFGLQTIFNNFISGLILLFERPIQVGDDLEIEGTWATVKKINVRSTVVQTYDNATLIIPNSDFISTKVTNLSFKDKRIRRKVHVGVEYGSDTELVRKTLLEVAKNNPLILKRPVSDVMFADFADSALLFTLRFWTNVFHFQMVETEVRFEIDRLFRERGIVIAYPQRDIHIKSINSNDLKPLLNINTVEDTEDLSAAENTDENNPPFDASEDKDTKE